MFHKSIVWVKVAVMSGLFQRERERERSTCRVEGTSRAVGKPRPIYIQAKPKSMYAILWGT